MTRWRLEATTTSGKLRLLRQPLLFLDSGHPVLSLNIQPVSNAVDVIKIPNHLNSHRDLGIAELQRSQLLNVIRVHPAWRKRQLHGVVAERSIRFIQFTL